MLAGLASAFVAKQASFADDGGQLRVFPTQITLNGPRSRQQLLVTSLTGQTTRDVTGEARWSSADNGIAEVRGGVVFPRGNGETTVRLRWQDHAGSLRVRVVNFSEPAPVSFRHETLAVLTRQGCNAGSCHGSPQGKGNFALSLFAYDPAFDARSLVRDGFHRRLNPNQPDQSLMLRKPLLRLPHVGGKRLRETDPAYRILYDWIRAGGPLDLNADVRCSGITVTPPGPRTLQMPGGRQQLCVTARFSDGTAVDVTHLARFETSHDDILTVDSNGCVFGQSRGQAAVSVRYLEFLVAVPFTVVVEVPDFRWNDPAENNAVDRLVHAQLRELQYLPSRPASDSVWIRRVTLDLTGQLPTSAQAKAFVHSDDPGKREQTIERLLASPEFSRFWAQKLCDLLRIDPQVLKDGRADRFARWVHQAIAQNRPFDQFARELLTATGAIGEQPAATYFLTVPSGEDRAETTAQLFMGSRIQCARCHNHPFENWTQHDYFRIAAVFHPIRAQDDVVAWNPEQKLSHPRTGVRLIPWGVEDEASTSVDPRAAFVDWLVAPDNRLFAAVEVNRIWSQLLGSGLVEPVDDFRASNPAAHPQLLDFLADEFRRGGYDRRAIIRLITLSQTYGRSYQAGRFSADDRRLATHYAPRLLTAEQLQDAIGRVTGTLPEPTEVSEADRDQFATQRLLPEQSEFLKAFGQPARKSPCACERQSEPTLDQALQLLNGTPLLNRAQQSANHYAGYSDQELVRELYWTAFARAPTEQEQTVGERFLSEAADRDEAIRDLVWTILNTVEFLFQH